MKKTLLTLSAALVAGAGMANTPRVFAGEGTPDFNQSMRTESKSLMEMVNKAGMAQPKLAKAPARVSAADPIIYEAPAGETVNYLRSVYGFYLYWWYILFGSNEGASDIVFGDDGYAYIHNPFGGWATNSYLKCEVKGDKLVATLPQAIYEEDSNAYDEETDEYYPVHTDYYATLLYQEIGEDGTVNYVMADTDEVQTISWTMDGDKITMDMEYDTTPDEEGYLSYPEVMFGMVSSEGVWTIAGDCAQEYNKVEVNPVVAPEGLETSEWAFVHDGAGSFVNVGFDGDDVYINNLDSSFPESYIKGKVDGDKVVFESGQYMGVYAGQHYIYFIGATFDESSYYMADNITLNYDAANKVMTAPEGTAMILNAALDRIYYLSVFTEPVIKVRNENPNPVPGAPIPSSFADYFEDYGYSYIQFSLPNLNADDDILSTDNMYYEVYIDGDLFTFYDDEYNIEEEMEQIPYSFSDGDGIYANGTAHTVSFYFSGYETVGLKLYNVVDGETYASPMTVWNVLDNSYYIDNNVGIQSVASGKGVAGVEYYNLQGMKLDRPAPGINVCRTTMEDGSVKVTKVLVK
ncbi:MAG: hypothetical protein HDR88_16860 [Bacteroides sp.]|nr:hypothetical protein [Bacteroides sp.]